MPIPYEIDPNEKLVYLTLPEETNLAETLEVMRRLAADEQFGEGFGILVDGQGLKSTPPPTEVWTLAEIVTQKRFLRHPIALVASRPVQYGIGNMISIIAGLRGAMVKAFYEMEEARAWLCNLKGGG